VRPYFTGAVFIGLRVTDRIGFRLHFIVEIRQQLDDWQEAFSRQRTTTAGVHDRRCLISWLCVLISTHCMQVRFQRFCTSSVERLARSNDFCYPHMPIKGKVWIYRLRFLCVFVRLRISPPRIKLAASNFSLRFIGVQGREPSILWTLLPRSPKSDESASAQATPTRMM